MGPTTLVPLEKLNALLHGRLRLGPRLIGDLALSLEEREGLFFALQRFEANEPLAKRIEHLITYNRAALMVALVLIGQEEYEDHDLWSAVGRRLGGALTSAQQVKLGQAFLEGLAMYKRLETFPDIERQAQRYLTPILLHGGVPKASLERFFSDLLWPALSGDVALSPLEALAVWRREQLGRGSLPLPRPLVRFLTLGGAAAVRFVEGSFALAMESRDEAEALLAPHVIAAYDAYMAGCRRSGQARPRYFRKPQWRVDPYFLGVYLHCFPQALLPGPERPYLKFEVDGESHVVTPDAFRGPDGWQLAECALPLKHWPSRLSVRLVDAQGREIGQASWRFTPEACLLFDEAGCEQTSARELLPGRYWLLHPASLVVAASLRAELPAPLSPLAGRSLSALALEPGSSHSWDGLSRYSVGQGGSAALRWALAPGTCGQEVFVEWPAIELRGPEAGAPLDLCLEPLEPKGAPRPLGELVPENGRFELRRVLEAAGSPGRFELRAQGHSGLTPLRFTLLPGFGWRTEGERFYLNLPPGASCAAVPATGLPIERLSRTLELRCEPPGPSSLLISVPPLAPRYALSGLSASPEVHWHTRPTRLSVGELRAATRARLCLEWPQAAIPPAFELFDPQGERWENLADILPPDHVQPLPQGGLRLGYDLTRLLERMLEQRDGALQLWLDGRWFLTLARHWQPRIVEASAEGAHLVLRYEERMPLRGRIAALFDLWRPARVPVLLALPPEACGAASLPLPGPLAPGHYQVQLLLKEGWGAPQVALRGPQEPGCARLEVGTLDEQKAFLEHLPDGIETRLLKLFALSALGEFPVASTYFLESNLSPVHVEHLLELFPVSRERFTRGMRNSFEEKMRDIFLRFYPHQTLRALAALPLRQQSAACDALIEFGLLERLGPAWLPEPCPLAPGVAEIQPYEPLDEAEREALGFAWLPLSLMLDPAPLSAERLARYAATPFGPLFEALLEAAERRHEEFKLVPQPPSEVYNEAQVQGLLGAMGESEPFDPGRAGEQRRLLLALQRCHADPQARQALHEACAQQAQALALCLEDWAAAHPRWRPYLAQALGVYRAPLRPKDWRFTLTLLPLLVRAFALTIRLSARFDALRGELPLERRERWRLALQLKRHAPELFAFELAFADALLLLETAPTTSERGPA